jgi:tetratricopeptide (TPR) repeat protein
VRTLQTLGRIWLAEGGLARAREQAELALALATEAHDRRAAECHDLLGAVYAMRTEWEAAEASFERALEIRERVGHAAGIVESLVGLGLVHQRRGAWPRARELYARAVEIASAIDPSPQAVASRRHLGRLLGLLGEETAAAEQMEQALALAEAMPRSFEYAPTLLAVAERRWRQGDLESATAYAERFLAAGMTAEVTVEARVVLATCHALAGRLDLAAPHAAEALALAERLGSPRLLGWAHLAAARVAAATGDLPAAARSFEAAIRQLEAARMPYDRALALRDYGQLLGARSNRPERARAMLSEALGIFQRLGAQPTAAGSEAILDDLSAGD